MRALFTKQALAIEAGQAVSGVARRAQTLFVRRGRVWITVEGVTHDYWLSAGDSFTAIPGRLVVVEADRDGSHVEIAASYRHSVLAPLRMLARRLSIGPGPKAGLQQCALASCEQRG